MLNWSVYLLVDPRAGAIRYVGQTRYPRDRMIGHISEDTPATRMWINGLKRDGLRPEMRIVQTSLGSSSAAREAEIKWILAMRAQGCSLLNFVRLTCAPI